MQEGLAAQRATGSEAIAPYFLALQAEIYGKMGQPEEGLAALTEASAMRQRTGERWYEAELYRLRGELSLRMGEREKKRTGEEEEKTPLHPFTPSPILLEACFLKAIAIAQRQQAKSLELRATMSRSLHDAGWTPCNTKHAPARRRSPMLSEVYNWFTEGFDTKDLQEAKALLEESLD